MGIGNGMRTLGTGLALAALAGAYVPQGYAQGRSPFRLPGGGSVSGVMNINGDDVTTGTRFRLPGGGSVTIMNSGSGSQQQNQSPQQELQYAQKRVMFGAPVLWQDLNRDGLMQPNEIVRGEPIKGIWYNVALELINAGGLLVRINVEGHPEMSIIAANDRTLIRQGVKFDGEPTTVRFDVLDGHSERRFYPREE